MFYVSDIEAAGGILIRERVLKKAFGYDVIECLLYIAGEKFKVVLKEYKKGKGIILEVKCDNEEDPYNNEYYKLVNILFQEEMGEGSFIIRNKKIRHINRLKAAVLKILTWISLLQSTTNIISCIQEQAILQPRGIVAVTSTIIGIIFVFLIDRMTYRYNRG